MQKFTSLSKIAVFFTLFLHSTLLSAQVKIQLENFATGFTKPVDIAHCGDSRLFIVEQRGVITILDSLGNKQSQPFLNIDPRVNSNGNEQGLLGLAFHPNFAQNGWFFVNYTQNNGDTRIARFTADLGSNPFIADPNSEKILLEIDQPYSNHNGGGTKFGADGYLYTSLGDGGSGGDPQNNGQKKATHLGKILRLDVNFDSIPYYKVPADNPFVGQTAYFPEIWSTGLRNVWRFSFDRLTGDMWMGDVGQNEWEEINFEPANEGGHNYGWRCYEGTHTYNTNGCLPDSVLTKPVYEYNHVSANGCSVTGGFVYRGSKYPAMYGQYIFADYCSGRFWRSVPNGDGTFTTSVLANLTAYQYTSFGEDYKGELYVATHGSGRIQRIKELCSEFKVDGVVLEPCPGANTGSISLTTTNGIAPYSYDWTGGGNAATYNNLAAGTYTVTVKDGNQCVQINTFTLTVQQPIDTPVISFLSGTAMNCFDDTTTVILTASQQVGNNYTYQWFRDGILIPNETGANIVIQNFSTADYSVQTIDAATGCASPLSIAQPVSFSGPTIGLGIRYVDGVISDDNWPLNWPGPYQWYFNGVPIPDATVSSYTPTQSGTYTLRYTFFPDCFIEATLDVLVSVNDLPQLKTFNLSPNPNDGLLLVALEFDQNYKIILSMTDVLGKVISQKMVEGQRINYTEDIRHLPSGTYFFQVQTENGQITRKIVKN
jgi:glucose/arabinose dehydrogenase